MCVEQNHRNKFLLPGIMSTKQIHRAIPEITGEQNPDTFTRWQMKINYTEAIISHLECINYHECYSHWVFCHYCFILVNIKSFIRFPPNFLLTESFYLFFIMSQVLCNMNHPSMVFFRNLIVIAVSHYKNILCCCCRSRNYVLWWIWKEMQLTSFLGLSFLNFKICAFKGSY